MGVHYFLKIQQTGVTLRSLYYDYHTRIKGYQEFFIVYNFVMEFSVLVTIVDIMAANE